MAAKIPFLTTAYFTRFATKQGNPGKYITYAEDHDTNYTLLANTINQIIDELRAAAGPNNLFNQDYLRRDDLTAPHATAQAEINGLIGSRSYLVTINGGDANLLDVQAGVAVVNTQRVESFVALTAVFNGVAQAFTNGGGYVNLDANGTPGIADEMGQGLLDIAKVSHNGSIYTAVAMLPDVDDAHSSSGSAEPFNAVMFDGDEYREQQERTALFGWPTKRFRSVAVRIRSIEQKLAGLTADDDGDAMGAFGLPPGDETNPGLVFTDGAGTEDDLTGWFRQAANVWAFAASSTERLRLGSFGIRTQDGSVGTPAIAATGDTDVGIRWGSALIGLVVAGADVLQLTAAQCAAVLGAVGAPSYAFIGDLTTGMYSPGAGRIGFSSTNTLALEVTAEAHIDSPTQPRVDWERNAVQNIANTDTLTVLTLDVENTNVGGWGTVGAVAEVPTGADGFYAITGTVEFEADSAGTRHVLISLNGAGTPLPNRQGEARHFAASAGVTKVPVCAFIDLAAGDDLRLEAAVTGAGGALDVTGGLSAVKLW